MSVHPIRIASAATLALALAAAPSAAAAGPTYGGSTTAGEPFVLTGDRAATKLMSAVIAVEATCDDGSFQAFTGTARPVEASAGISPPLHTLRMSRNGRGRFAGEIGVGFTSGDLSGFFTTALAGRLKAHRASGTLRMDVQFVDDQGNETGSCHSGTLHWSAARSPGRVYGGSTSQEEPVVIELDKRRKKVTDMRVGWESSSCTPPGFIRLGDRLSGFPLRSGHFGDTWNESYDGSDMSSEYAYTLAGTISRRSAKGTLRVGLTDTDVHGAAMLSCDSGRIRWSAVTG